MKTPGKWLLLWTSLTLPRVSLKPAIMLRIQTMTALCAFALLSACSKQETESADLIFKNGVIYTVDPARPWAEAIAIKGDRILRVEIR